MSMLGSFLPSLGRFNATKFTQSEEPTPSYNQRSLQTQAVRVALEILSGLFCTLRLQKNYGNACEREQSCNQPSTYGGIVRKPDVLELYHDASHEHHHQNECPSLH